MGLFNRAAKTADRDASRKDDVDTREPKGEEGWGIESTQTPTSASNAAPASDTAVEPTPSEAPEKEAPMNENAPTSQDADQQLSSATDADPQAKPATEASKTEAQPSGGVADELDRVEGGDATPEFKVTREPEPVDDAPRLTAQEALAPSRTPADPSDPEAGGDGRRAKVISFANQKGGVAKTTTTLNLAVAFAEQGYRALVIDLDPQGNLTMSQGIDPDKVEKSMYDVLVTHMPLREVIQHREIDVAVSSIDLAGAEIAMSTQIGRERSLEKAIKAISSDYDFICIDTPPSLGLLTINALTASDRVIVPVQCEYLSMRGLMQLQNTLEMIRENLNPKVQIEGILPTMLDTRTVHAKEAVEILEENFGDLVFKSRIRKAIKFAEAPVRGSSVLKYDSKSTAAEHYRDLAKEVLAKEIVTNGAS